MRAKTPWFFLQGAARSSGSDGLGATAAAAAEGGAEVSGADGLGAPAPAANAMEADGAGVVCAADGLSGTATTAAAAADGAAGDSGADGLSAPNATTAAEGAARWSDGSRVAEGDGAAVIRGHDVKSPDDHQWCTGVSEAVLHLLTQNIYHCVAHTMSPATACSATFSGPTPFSVPEKRPAVYAWSGRETQERRRNTSRGSGSLQCCWENTTVQFLEACNAALG